MEKRMYSKFPTDIPMLFFQSQEEVKRRTTKIATDSEAPVMLTIKEVALRTGVSQHFVRNLCKSNQIVYVKSGKKYLVNYNKFREFLNTGK